MAIRFLKVSYQSRYLIFQLTKRDFKNRYVGSILGLLWAFLQPLAMMVILWFVFEHGLKARTVNAQIPFVAWFFSAVIAWNFFADVVLANTGVLGEYAFMLKKVEFKMAILPAIKIFSSLLIHLIFLLILAVVLICNHIYPSWYWLQIPYFTLALIYLLLGIGLLTSALNIFIRDTYQAVSILIQFGFWLTPVIWNIDMLPGPYRTLIKLNPMVYITEGYRGCLIYKKSLFEVGIHSTLYFWTTSTCILLLGIFIFRKLRPHFGDVL